MFPVDKWSLPGNGSSECPSVITVRRLTPLTEAAISPPFNNAAAIDQLSGAGSLLSVSGSLGGPGDPAGLPEPPSGHPGTPAMPSDLQPRRTAGSGELSVLKKTVTRAESAKHAGTRP